MSNINRVILCGRTTADAKTKTAGDSTVTEFTVATNFYAGKGKEDGVSFIDCYAWGHTGATIEKYFPKGAKIFVEGEMRQDRWEKDGQKKSRVRVLVNRFEFGESKKNTEPASAPPSEGPAPDVADDDGVPF